jgi:hypothetical protein
MQNQSSIRIKPVTIIHRNCSSLNRLLEVVLTMPHPVIYMNTDNETFVVTVNNANGICIYDWFCLKQDVTDKERIMIQQLQDIYISVQ